MKERGIKSLAEIHSERERIPSSVVELSPAERKLLADTDWIDEDDTDLILSLRIEKKGGPSVSLRDLIRSTGREVKD